jgi:hypothetical protein
LIAITKEAWNAVQQTEDERENIQALSLAKECYSMKMDLLTNATVVDDAFRFVSQESKNKEEIKSSLSNEDAKESNEPDYDDKDKDQPEEDQEEETVEGTIITTNEVF